MAVSLNKLTSNFQRPSEDFLTVLQITDLHLFADPDGKLLGIQTEKSFLSVLMHAHQHHNPDLILLTGDLTQDASSEAYQRLHYHLKLLDTPCYCLPGNHDNPLLLKEILNSDNVHTTQQILKKGWQIICLDSKLPGEEEGHLANDQLELLDQCLENQPNLPSLIVFHHPPLPVNSPWLDTMTLNNPGELFEILAKHPQAKALLLGHVHQQQDWIHNGLRLLTAPSTCFQFKPQSKEFALDHQPPGYRWLKLFADGSIETEVYRLNAIPEGMEKSSTGY